MASPLIFVAALSSAVLSAQADWTQLAPAVSPSPRAGAVGVSDGALLYNFGGKPGPGVEFNDMWVFDGANWIDITTASGALPPGRDFYAATFDTTRGVYVLFGGRSSALSVDKRSKLPLAEQRIVGGWLKGNRREGSGPPRPRARPRDGALQSLTGLRRKRDQIRVPRQNSWKRSTQRDQNRSDNEVQFL